MRKDPNRILRGAAFWAAVVVAGGTVVAALVNRPAAPSPAVQGRITAPLSGRKVPSVFTVEGTLSAIPRGRHVWVAVKIGNSLWPKDPEITAAHQRWNLELDQSASPSGGRFSLVLIMVDKKGQSFIENWLEDGRKGKGYPGISDIPGASQLDVVSDLIRE
jgi:hypothetical protein